MEQMHPERDGHAQPQHRHEQTGRQNILNFFLAFIAIAWAVVFGVFSILSWRSAEKANEQAELANLIALADMCGGSVQDVSLRPVSAPTQRSMWHSMYCTIQHRDYLLPIWNRTTSTRFDRMNAMACRLTVSL